MKYFIDTANVDEIKQASELGIIRGVTTNPSLIAKEGRKFEDVIEEIANIVDGPISAEVISLEAEGMIEEAEDLQKIHPNIVIKIPMTAEGIKATSILSKELIKVNVTLVFSVTQALAAAMAGAAYVSPFIGRLDDVGANGVALLEEIMWTFQRYDIKTEVIAASIRNKEHIVAAAAAGVDIATVPYKVLMDSLKHPLTDQGIEKFLKDWNK
ncbi:fructose-6-phosphate aldolase [Alkalibacter rhizosphaerae]|uniref:Probable transaldolase n=1 Tax=Alkalibacter rhizosphaerae TaxID=2815577 RepID=A0A975AH00_9FIRM|nr:fructose-6-phosphate aldolase [Alkalibacter rhizosphaerae]QSX08089.1 fructose-6-phosphate aldolase [Alkalibacter rhizosphaerae]